MFGRVLRAARGPSRRGSVVFRWAGLLAILGMIWLVASSGPGSRAIGQAAKTVTGKGRPARSMLTVKSVDPSILTRRGDVVREDATTYRETLIALMKTRIVLGPALRDPRVKALPIVAAQADPFEWLAQNLRAEFIPGTELLTVSLELPDHAEAQAIVDAVVAAFMDTVVEEGHGLRIQRLEELRKLMSQYQSQIKERRVVMRQLAHRTTNYGRATEIRLQLARADIEDGRKELRGIKLRKATDSARLAQLREKHPVLVGEINALDESLAILSSQETHLLKEQEKLFNSLTSEDDRRSVDLQTEKSELDAAEAMLRQITQEVETLGIELQAPRRITVLSPAD